MLHGWVRRAKDRWQHQAGLHYSLKAGLVGSCAGAGVVRQFIAMLCKSIELECERHVSKSSDTEEQDSRFSFATLVRQGTYLVQVNVGLLSTEVGP